MAGFNSENLVDLAKTTLNSLGEPNYTNLMSDLQEYVAFSRLYDKARQEDSGKGIQWDVALNPSNNAENVGLYQEDNLNVMDGMTQASVNWRNSRGGYAISKQEISMNTGKRQIVDLFKFKRAQGMVDMANLLEENFWKFPAASDTLTPLGLPYWVTKAGSATACGFNAALPTGYTDVAGLVPASQPRWNPWSGLYVDVSKDDLVRKMREAFRKCQFKSPVATPSNNTGYKYTINTNYAVVGRMEELLESQNDSLGNDIASKDGQVMFRKMPVEYVPYLDADTTNPVYGLNWGEFKVKNLKSWWMQETVLDKTPGQHTVISVFFDCTYQIMTYNRRSHFIFATATSYPG